MADWLLNNRSLLPAPPAGPPFPDPAARLGATPRAGLAP